MQAILKRHQMVTLKFSVYSRKDLSTMAVKLILRLKVTEAHQQALQRWLDHMHSLVSKQLGYFYAETLVDHQRPGEYLNITTWRSADHCRQWLCSREWSGLQQLIGTTIGAQASFHIKDS